MATPEWIRNMIANGTVLLDGAWGTELQARGLPPGEMPDSWNLHQPDRVEAVARSYVEAGSQIILTNTFRSNRIAFSGHRDADRITEINRAGVEVSRRASGGKCRVFASIGPSGRLLMKGDVTHDALSEAFDEQARALADAGSDGLVVETMTDLAEAEIAITAAKATGLPVVACMVFDSGKLKDRTAMGVTAAEAAAALAGFGADIVGANCGIGIEGYVPICSGLSAATTLPIWIKANAGIPEFVDGEFRYTTTPEEFAAFRGALVDAGASFMGGCCGTSPSFIRALAAARDVS